MLNVVKCGIGDCSSVFKTEEAVSPNVRYVCKNHSEVEQRVFFQDHQFDENLKRGIKPIGTAHIKRQGNEHLEQDKPLHPVWGLIQESIKEKK